MSDLLTFFAEVLGSSIGIIFVFGVLLAVSLAMVNKIIIEKWITSHVWQKVLIILLITTAFIVYGVGSWYPSFLFTIPLWSETLNDNVLSIVNGVLVLTYGIVINHRLQVKKIETNLRSSVMIIFIIFIIIGIVQVILEDYLMLPIASFVIGIVVILVARLTHQKIIYIGMILIITGISGFIFMSIFGNSIGKSSMAISAIISVIGIAVVNTRKKSEINVYCKNNPDSDVCKAKF